MDDQFTIEPRGNSSDERKPIAAGDVGGFNRTRRQSLLLRNQEMKLAHDRLAAGVELCFVGVSANVTSAAAAQQLFGSFPARFGAGIFIARKESDRSHLRRILMPTTISKPILQTNIPGWPVRRGKVRDCYDLGDRMLLVSTVRIRASDWVLPTGIPDKGRVLTQIS